MTQYFEQYNQELFDPTFGLNQTIFGQYQTCSMECVISSNNPDCYDECERQFLENLYDAADHTMEPYAAYSFYA